MAKNPLLKIKRHELYLKVLRSKAAHLTRSATENVLKQILPFDDPRFGHAIIEGEPTVDRAKLPLILRGGRYDSTFVIRFTATIEERPVVLDYIEFCKADRFIPILVVDGEPIYITTNWLASEYTLRPLVEQKSERVKRKATVRVTSVYHLLPDGVSALGIAAIEQWLDPVVLRRGSADTPLPLSEVRKEGHKLRYESAQIELGLRNLFQVGFLERFGRDQCKITIRFRDRYV